MALNSNVPIRPSPDSYARKGGGFWDFVKTIPTHLHTGLLGSKTSVPLPPRNSQKFPGRSLY